jgi:hypothetical protein
MSAIKELDTLLHQLIQAEEKTDEYATIIGNVEHIHDEYEPADHIEDLYITALVQAEILAETVVDLLHPQDFANDDNFWHAIVNVRLYIQDTDRHQISISGLQEAVKEAI